MRNAVALLIAAILGTSLAGAMATRTLAAQVPTTTTLVAESTLVGAYDPIRFVATVEPAPPDGGTVSLYFGVNPIMVRDLSPDGTALFELPAGLGPSTYRFDAGFNGTTSSAPSYSEKVDIVVFEDRASTSITVVSDNTPTLRGTPADFTVTTSPDPGTGAIVLRRAQSNSFLASQLNAPGGVTAIAFTPMSAISFDYDIKACFEGNATTPKHSRVESRAGVRVAATRSGTSSFQDR
jgi:hypothetical protein